MADDKKNPLTQGGEPTQNALNDAMQGAEAQPRRAYWLPTGSTLRTPS